MFATAMSEGLGGKDQNIYMFSQAGFALSACSAFKVCSFSTT